MDVIKLAKANAADAFDGAYISGYNRQEAISLALSNLRATLNEYGITSDAAWRDATQAFEAEIVALGNLVSLLCLEKVKEACEHLSYDDNAQRLDYTLAQVANLCGGVVTPEENIAIGDVVVEMTPNPNWVEAGNQFSSYKQHWPRGRAYVSGLRFIP